MKKLFVSALAMLAVALGFTACSSEDEFVKETPAQGKKVTVIATTEEPAQRTALGDWDSDKKEFKVVWSEGDQIKFGINDQYVFTLKSGAGTSTGVFEGTAPANGNNYFVSYPADGGPFPTEQTYVEGRWT